MEKLRSLYNDWEVSTPEANDLYREVSHLLEPIFKRSVANNLRIRDVAHTINSVVGELEAYHNIKRNMEAHKRTRGETECLIQTAIQWEHFYAAQDPTMGSLLVASK